MTFIWSFVDVQPLLTIRRLKPVFTTIDDHAAKNTTDISDRIVTNDDFAFAQDL